MGWEKNFNPLSIYRSSPEKDFTPSSALVNNPLPEVSKQSFLDQKDGATTEISITSGYVLAEDSSPKKLKKGKKTERKDETKGETYRQLRRRNIIMEAVRQHSVIDDPTKLYKMIQESEIQEGQSAKMDKKSLMRLISKLGKEGQIHNIRCVFQVKLASHWSLPNTLNTGFSLVSEW